MLSRDLRRLILIGVLVAVAAASIAVQRWDLGVGSFRFKRGSETFLGLQLGLDLQGGVHLVYEAQTENPTSEQMEGVLQTIERRVNAFGVAEPNIQTMGGNRLLVQLPGVANVEEAKRLIGETATLVFKERKCQDELCAKYEDKDIGLTGDDLARAYPGQEPDLNRPVVFLEFNSRGGKLFGEVTGRIAGTNNRVAIFLDTQELVAPVARQAILGGRAFIEGPDFTAERVRTIAIQLESGRLPIPVKVIQEQSVDATLGADSLRKSIVAGYVGLALMALFMLLYYRGSGGLASVALLFYMALTLAVFKLVPITLTLTGIAGFILSIGMAVDANVLIFERMKEELRGGRTFIAAIDSGFGRAWPSIRDSNISTFITCAILFWFGTRMGASVVIGFAVTLAIGVAVSMFTAITVSRVLLRLAAWGRGERILALLSPAPGIRPGTQTARIPVGRG